MSWAPIATIADDVNAGRVKAIDLVEQALAAIEEHKDYQAIISTLADAARSQAKSIDEKVANGVNAGRLAGVPFIAKDNLLVMGVEATAASKWTVVGRSLREAARSLAIFRNDESSLSERSG